MRRMALTFGVLLSQLARTDLTMVVAAYAVNSAWEVPVVELL